MSDIKINTKASNLYDHDEPINAKILSISEDLINGFHEKPFHLIAQKSGIDLKIVLERIRLMLEHGIIRRVRQTILTNKVVDGALVAWKINSGQLNKAFDFMSKDDPFSGHVVLRTTDRKTLGSDFHLWTTLKVPVGESITKHCDVLKKICGADDYIVMPAKGIFTLGVGHVRRKTLKPGEKADNPASMISTQKKSLSKTQWNVLLTLKEELTLDEICENPWEQRARRLNISMDEFCNFANDFEKLGVLGRFSTFLEHVKPSDTGKRVTRFNGLFHWKVPIGMEEKAGAIVGSFYIITHCYWREGGENFGNVNIMAVAHGTEKELILKHKKAIDEELEKQNIPFDYTNVFWGGRSEIKPSEISPEIYKKWHLNNS